MTQRLFIAIYPPAAAVADLAAVAAQLPFSRPHAGGLSLRPVPPEQWHVTVAFLGTLDDAQTAAAQTAMRAAAAGTVRTPRLRLTGGGRFDNGRAGAAWTGLDGDVDALHDLTARLRGLLTAAGVPFDARPYQPHLTLARPGDRLGPDQWREVLDRLDAYAGPAWPAAALSLMRSDHPVGNHYTEICTAPLPRG